MIEQRYRTDILVVGAGPAGVAAAFRAAESGARVLVVDDNPQCGGQIWRADSKKALDKDATKWLDRIRDSSVKFLGGLKVFDRPEPGVMRAEGFDQVVACRFEKLILATGARERFLPFPGWTLPNVTGSGGLQALVKAGLPIEGKRIVVAGSGPLLLAVAGYLKERGAKIQIIAEQTRRFDLVKLGLRLLKCPKKLQQAFDLKMKLQGIPYLTNCWPVSASGRNAVESVTLQQGPKEWAVSCDYLACGFHLLPNTELAELLGCRIEKGSVWVDEFQETSVQGLYCVGESCGVGGLELALVEGEVAGWAATNLKEKARERFSERRKWRGFAAGLNRAFELRRELKKLPTPETFICRCEDVPFSRLQSEHSWRSAKLQTRCGMGPCQGRVCGPATEFLFGWKTESVRPPVFPVRLGSFVPSSAGDAPAES
ncbi:MAG: FAD/NAD(P)-binding oxidoreductase [Acidobacteriia bacterium]|nr:FAD/NAD(P)-binding oxidoreductase [Terriglobia bacterium]